MDENPTPQTKLPEGNAEYVAQLAESAPKDHNVLLKIDEVAEWLRVDSKTVRKAVQNNNFPCLKITRSTWRFHIPTILNYFKKQSL